MQEYSTPKLSTTLIDNKRVFFVSFMFTDQATGKRKQFQFRGEINKEETTGERKIEGMAYVEALSGLLKDGWNPFDETPGGYVRRKAGGFIGRPKTLGEVLDECYNLKIKQLTGTEGVRTYKYIFEHFKKWVNAQMLAKMKPDGFTVMHAMAYADTLTKEGKKGRGFNNYRSVIKVFFNMMVDRELISKNPFTKIKPAKVIEAEIVPFQDLELQAIRKHLQEHDPGLRVFCEFIFYLLLRPIEVLRLQVKHIDLKRNTINLPAISSKSRKTRFCNIPPALKIILTTWLKYESVNDYIFGYDLKTDPRPLLRRNSVTQRHKKVLDKLEFDGKLSLYSYKYSGVIAAYLAGISIEEIRAQAGHHSIEITQMYMVKLGLIKSSSFGTVNY